ncbi:hypothetical protein OROHE_012142 [Orobanche hederae]
MRVILYFNQAGRLLQQYIVDSYMAVEQERFRWIQTHQKELYLGLMDAVQHGDSDCSIIGKSIILPSSHTGGPRYRPQNYQDAMAICPDLFITFTCNPKWPEINEMLNMIGQNDDPNRFDVVCRIFEIKACMYTIEFQKRGLPHAHIPLFLHPSMKNPSADYIDTIISAEIPDPNVDYDGYNAVKKSMLHGPCGQSNNNSPCMFQGKCSKHFPKKFNDRTTIGEDGFPIYRRRNTGIQVQKGNALLDNRYMVPYNRNLLVKFDAHINVELCNSARSIKYLFNVPGIAKTKFTEWLETNRRHEDARNLTYSEFPREWVWNAKDKTWTRRKNGVTVGRIYFAHPASGERFYMRMLLNFVKGGTSFESIRTVNGVTYPNYKAACYALGFFGC